MIPLVNLLNKMIYVDSGDSTGAANVEAAVLHETYSITNLKTFFVAMIGFLAIMAFIWVYLTLLSWIIERKHIIAIRKISFFKILTFGKLEAAEIGPMQMFLIWLIAHVVIILVLTGSISKIVIKVFTFVMSLYYKLVGGA